MLLGRSPTEQDGNSATDCAQANAARQAKKVSENSFMSVDHALKRQKFDGRDAGRLKKSTRNECDVRRSTEGGEIEIIWALFSSFPPSRFSCSRAVKNMGSRKQMPELSQLELDVKGGQDRA